MSKIDKHRDCSHAAVMEGYKNADFWVVAATVASALIIANGVVVTQMLSGPINRYTGAAYSVSAVSAGICSLAIFDALASLADRADRGLGSTHAIGPFMLAATLLTFGAAALAGAGNPNSGKE